MEEGVIRLSRARGTVTLPSRFLLVAAMNPCPCGEGLQRGQCKCSESMRARYTRRLSGPLLDRFDLAVPMSRPSPEELFRGERGETTACVAERVAEVRSLAAHRGVRSNAELPSSDLNEVAHLAPQAAALLERKFREGQISARGLHRIHKVARTIADLDKSSAVSERHVAEAIHLRSARSVLLTA